MAIDLHPKAAGSTPQPKVIHEAEPSFDDQLGKLVIRKDQIITPELLAATHEARLQTEREGEFMHVAAIPTVIVEEWMNQGFNILTDRNITARQIVARLKAQGLDQFLATSKRV